MIFFVLISGFRGGWYMRRRIIMRVFKFKRRTLFLFQWWRFLNVVGEPPDPLYLKLRDIIGRLRRHLNYLELASWICDWHIHVIYLWLTMLINAWVWYNDIGSWKLLRAELLLLREMDLKIHFPVVIIPKILHLTCSFTRYCLFYLVPFLSIDL